MMLRNTFLMMAWGGRGISAFEDVVEFGLEEGVAFVVFEDVLDAAGEKGRIIKAVLVILRGGRKLPDGAGGKSICCF